MSDGELAEHVQQRDISKAVYPPVQPPTALHPPVVQVALQPAYNSMHACVQCKSLCKPCGLAAHGIFCGLLQCDLLFQQTGPP